MEISPVSETSLWLGAYLFERVPLRRARGLESYIQTVWKNFEDWSWKKIVSSAKELNCRNNRAHPVWNSPYDVMDLDGIVCTDRVCPACARVSTRGLVSASS